ncbi:winged helix-turn-helix domain-containing protein [Hydrogenophaga aquatica]
MDILFEDFVLDPARREFTKNGAEVLLEPQVFDLLVYLVRERERVIDKDELVHHVWKGRIVSDSTIESRLSVLRKALCDDGRRQRLIRTYARKGVRFVGCVQENRPDGELFPLAPPVGAVADDKPPGPPDARPSVAVIPFNNLGGNPTQDHLAEGIAADIIALLTRSRMLFVLARNASFGLKHADPAKAAAMLGADYLVDGTIRCAQGRLRITFQLVDTTQGYVIWAEHYDCEVNDIFEVQDDIAEKIVGRIEPEIGRYTRSRILRHPPSSLQAWDHFHLGMSHLYRATPGDNQTAQAWFRKALTLDPRFALAHAFLSYAVVLSMIYFDAEPVPRLLDDALGLAKRAVELDGEDATVRFALGRALTVLQRYDDAIAEMTIATELNPALAIAWCGLADSYVYVGQFERAYPLFQHAISLSPHDPMRWAFHAYCAQAHLFARDFLAADTHAQQAVRTPSCHYWPFAHRVAALGHLGAEPAATSAAREQLLNIKPDFSCGWAHARLFYVRDPEQREIYIDGLRRAGLPAA